MESSQTQEKKETKGSPLYKIVLKVFLSRTVRNIVLMFILIFSAFCMMMMDANNGVLKEYFPFLKSNVIKSIMNLLHIKSFNVTFSAWIIFGCIAGTLFIFLLANIFAPKIVGAIVKSKRDSFKTELGAKRFFATMYYLIIFVVCAAIIFVLFMSGTITATFNQHTAGLFLNLLYTVLLCVMFIILTVVLFVVLYYLIRLIIFLVLGLFKGLKVLVKDVRVVKEKEEDTKEKTDSLDDTTAEEKTNDAEGKDLFPSLTAIDNRYSETTEQEVADTDITLNEFILRFQSHAINNYQIYYELPLLRSFIAGMSATRLIILEGLSGTGKSLLPRMFSRFTGSTARFAPVQATWRDKTDVLGFFSEFTKTFKMTDFLCNLYEASYVDQATLMVLDEMNLSRIEYYFADFLSILEYPQEEWRVKVYDPELGQKLPQNLAGGYVTIPANTWFIGTANTDDSTFTITDKVYDRAITLDFRERIAPLTSDYNAEPIRISAEKLQQLFAEAQSNAEYRLNEEDTNKFLGICDFMRDAFDIRFGNRIMVQINQFVPVYVALGGTKEEALDFMFTSKVMRKLNGMFEDYVKDELIALQKLLADTYGKGTFVETERVISKILKKLI